MNKDRSEEAQVSSEWRNEKGFWPCSHCGKILYRKRKLMEHIAHLHTHEYRFHCKFCGRGFYTDSRKREHEYRSHQKPVKQPKKVKQDKFTCALCNTKFNCNSFLQDHIVRIHTKKFRFFCDLCGMGFYLKSRKVYHVNKYHEGEPQKRRRPRSKSRVCEQLIQSFSHRKQYSLQKEGGGIRCPVEGCEKVVSSKGNLGSHLDSHDNQKYICEYCSKVFTHYPSLERHIKTHKHGIKTFTCDICNKILTTSSNLLYHKRIHTGEKPAQCEHCGKGFTCVRDLNIHRKRHHQDLITKYTCKICQKKFTIYGKLRQHYAKYHPDHEVEDEKDL